MTDPARIQTPTEETRAPVGEAGPAEEQPSPLRVLHPAEICVECGRSVAFGSGRFVNRVPVCDDFDTNVEAGRPYPHGGFVCHACDEAPYEEARGEGLYCEEHGFAGSCPDGCGALKAAAPTRRELSAEERRELDRLRREAADDAREGFDFGARVAAMNGWESTTEPAEAVWSSTVFVEREDDPRADSVAVTLAVTFAAYSARILSAELA